jgi:hypothetical protein
LLGISLLKNDWKSGAEFVGKLWSTADERKRLGEKSPEERPRG